MALYEISPAQAAGAQASGAKLARPVELICFALIVVNAVYLSAATPSAALRASLHRLP